MRELLKDDRRLFKLRSLRTPFGFLSCGDDVYAAEAGEVGVRKLSALSSFELSILCSMFSFSDSGAIL